MTLKSTTLTNGHLTVTVSGNGVIHQVTATKGSDTLTVNAAGQCLISEDHQPERRASITEVFAFVYRHRMFDIPKGENTFYVPLGTAVMSIEHPSYNETNFILKAGGKEVVVAAKNHFQAREPVVAFLKEHACFDVVREF